MTVKQLIKELLNFDGEHIVKISVKHDSQFCGIVHEIATVIFESGKCVLKGEE